jgi:dihydrodipicolinate synthase/N-acetylneuraminate lyase
VPIKHMVWRMGLIPSPECRRPLAPLPQETAFRIDDALSHAGLL